METVEDRVIDLPERSRPGSTTRMNGNGTRRSGSTHVQHPTLLAYLRAKRLGIVCFVVVACGFAALVLYRNPVSYSSSVTLILHDRSTTTGEKPGHLPDDVPNYVRAFQLPLSTEMLEHLTGKFDLYKHYGIDPTGPLHYELVSTRLLENITVQRMDDRSATVTVRDQDRERAAEMANAVYDKLQEMNEAQVMSDLERGIALYQRVIGNTEKRSAAQTVQLIALVTELKGFAGSGAPADRVNDRITALDFQLTELAAQLVIANEDLSKAAQAFEMSAALRQESDAPDIHLVRKAIQDIHTSKKGIWIRTLLFTGIGAFMLSLVVLSIWYKHGHEVMHDIALLNSPAAH